MVSGADRNQQRDRARCVLVLVYGFWRPNQLPLSAGTRRANQPVASIGTPAPGLLFYDPGTSPIRLSSIP